MKNRVRRYITRLKKKANISTTDFLRVKVLEKIVQKDNMKQNEIQIMKQRLQRITRSLTWKMKIWEVRCSCPVEVPAQWRLLWKTTDSHQFQDPLHNRRNLLKSPPAHLLLWCYNDTCPWGAQTPEYLKMTDTCQDEVVFSIKCTKKENPSSSDEVNR